jgi:hypothetical protein
MKTILTAILFITVVSCTEKPKPTTTISKQDSVNNVCNHRGHVWGHATFRTTWDNPDGISSDSALIDSPDSSYVLFRQNITRYCIRCHQHITEPYKPDMWIRTTWKRRHQKVVYFDHADTGTISIGIISQMLTEKDTLYIHKQITVTSESHNCDLQYALFTPLQQPVIRIR